MVWNSRRSQCGLIVAMMVCPAQLAFGPTYEVRHNKPRRAKVATCDFCAIPPGKVGKGVATSIGHPHKFRSQTGWPSSLHQPGAREWQRPQHGGIDCLLHPFRQIVGVLARQMHRDIADVQRTAAADGRA
jgi:hypothetical protein